MASHPGRDPGVDDSGVQEGRFGALAGATVRLAAKSVSRCFGSYINLRPPGLRPTACFVSSRSNGSRFYDLFLSALPGGARPAQTGSSPRPCRGWPVGPRGSPGIPRKKKPSRPSEARRPPPDSKARGQIPSPSSRRPPLGASEALGTKTARQKLCRLGSKPCPRPSGGPRRSTPGTRREGRLYAAGRAPLTFAEGYVSLSAVLLALPLTCRRQRLISQSGKLHRVRSRHRAPLRCPSGGWEGGHGDADHKSFAAAFGEGNVACPASFAPPVPELGAVGRSRPPQHHVNTGFRLLTGSSRSTMTLRRLPSMPSAAA